MKLKAYLCLLVPCLLLCAMVSCNPNSADLPVLEAKSGLVSYFNLIPNGPEINFYVNGTRQNTNKIAYQDNSGYMSIVSGPQSVLFKTDSLRNDLFEPALNVTIPTDSSTIYVTGKQAGNLIFVRDTALADNSKTGYRSKLRFINASADAPAFDITLNNVAISNQAYKSISPFARVDTGVVTLKLNLAGTSSNIITTTVPLAANKVYTMFVYGSYTSAAGLSLGIIANH